MKISDPKPKPLENDEYDAIKFGLDGYNEKFTGSLLREDVSSVLKDDTNNTLGAIIGEINWGWLYIKALWIDESIRNMGWGRKLLYGIEKYSLSKGISKIRLETTTFQALGFYEKQGYEVFAELKDLPPGETSFFLRKFI